MGTSRSSTGAGGGVPLVPGWLDQPSDAPIPPVAMPTPGERFKPARLKFGKFVDDGERGTLRSALGRYVNQGYGGAAGGAARMAQAAATAERAYGVLSGLAGEEGAPPPPFDPGTLAGRSTHEIISRIVDAIRPEQTTLDDAASRQAASEAISVVLDGDPDADPLALTAEQAGEVFVLTLAFNIFEILRLDVGEAIQRNANGNPDLEQGRLSDIRDFIVETVRARFARLREQGRRLAAGFAGRMASEILRLTMDVFAEDVG